MFKFSNSNKNVNKFSKKVLKCTYALTCAWNISDRRWIFFQHYRGSALFTTFTFCRNFFKNLRSSTLSCLSFSICLFFLQTINKALFLSRFGTWCALINNNFQFLCFTFYCLFNAPHTLSRTAHCSTRKLMNSNKLDIYSHMHERVNVPRVATFNCDLQSDSCEIAQGESQNSNRI
jgi:hypothetical protein